jgi:hypothetical protein
MFCNQCGKKNSDVARFGFRWRVLMITTGTLIFAAGIVTGGRLEPPVGAQGFTVVMDCGASSAPQLRTTLYFGLARPKGAVTELEWQIFLRDGSDQAVSERADRVGGGGPVADTRWQHRSRAVEGPAPGPSRYAGGAAIGPRRYRRVSQDVRAAIRSVGKRARVWRGVVPEVCRWPLSGDAGSR